MKRFIKSSDTTVPAARSQVELERILRRYGAAGFGVSTDYEHRLIRVFFRVPDSPLDKTASVPVRLEVSIGGVAQSLGFLIEDAERTWRRRKPSNTEWERAERVAWRHLVLWVDAALSAATAGLQKVSEAFLAHTLVRGPDGAVMRVVDQMDALSGGNWRALLPASTTESGV